MIHAFTGIRDLAPESEQNVMLAILKALQPGDQARFGGARGADTIALRAAGKLPGVDRIVIVPDRVSTQPVEARRAIEQFATRVIELKLGTSAGAYHARNRVVVAGDARYGIGRSDRVTAFIDQRSRGGTHSTAEYAAELGIPIVRVTVVASTA